MVGSLGLDVGVIVVQAKIDKTGFRFVHPFALAIVKLARARLEWNAVQRDTKPISFRPNRRGGFHRMNGHLEVVILR